MNDHQMISSNFDPVQLQELNQKAQEFNFWIKSALEAQQYTKDWYPLFNAFFTASHENDISLKALTIPGVEANFSYNGLSPNQTSMIKFRDELEASGHFINLEIPLQSIIQQKNRVEFNLKGKVRL